MHATDSTWRASRAVYRVLVAGQTIAWAIWMVVARFVLRQPHGLLDAGVAGLILAILCLVGLVAALLTYAIGPRPDVGATRGTVILTWACLQAAGLLALLGHVLSGKGICFAGGVLALVLMHGFGPGRLPGTEIPA